MLSQIVIFTFIAFSKVLASVGGIPLTQDAQLSMAKGAASRGLETAQAQLADDEFTDGDSSTDDINDQPEPVDGEYGNPNVTYYTVPREEGQMLQNGSQVRYIVPSRNKNMQASYEIEDENSEMTAKLSGKRPVYMRQNAVNEDDDDDDTDDDTDDDDDDDDKNKEKKDEKENDDDDDDDTDGDPTNNPGYEEAALG